jgi:hypothetical protein
MSTAAAYVVYDLESAAEPVFLGWYLRADEDVIVYERLSGEVASAPADCVEVRVRERCAS